MSMLSAPLVAHTTTRSMEPSMDTIGALVLRGNRCVLVRSLSKPPAWEGMQLPKVVPRAGETAMAAAMRAADECCNIDASSELEPLPNILLSLPTWAAHDAFGFYAKYPQSGATLPDR